MEHSFDIFLLIFGAVMVIGVLCSGLAHRTFLSLTALFVLFGFLLGPGVFNVIHFEADSAFVTDLALIALIVILFRDGLEVEAQTLRNRWRIPLRKLLIAMPLTCIFVTGISKFMFGLDWPEALLLGALLSPTDPILASAIVTNKKVPKQIRSSLNLESGLNDGLALPAVLAFATLISASAVQGEHFVWWQFIIQDIGLGVVYGIVLGFLGSYILPRQVKWSRHLIALYAFGFAFFAYGLAHIGPHGNGLIAVFVCAITFGILRNDAKEAVDEQTAEWAELVKLAVFLVFGALLTFQSLFSEGVLLTLAFVVACLFICRPIAIIISLIGSKDLDIQTKLFFGWFGPKGIGTMAFGLLVLSYGIPGGEMLFDLAAAVVFFSIILHGVTDTWGSNWIASHYEKKSSEKETDDVL